jgi:hypothetical protein
VGKKNRSIWQGGMIIIILLLNLYSNPYNNPLRSNDPTSYITCAGWRHTLYGIACDPAELYGEEGYLYWLIDTEAYLPLNKTVAVSAWKIGVEVNGYGIVDLSHATGSFDIAEQIFCGIQMVINNGQNSLLLRWQGLEIRYSVNPDILMDEDAVISTAYGIFQDFSERFENFQDKQGFPRSLSAFSQEDLAANHIGFYAYIYYRDEDKAAAIAKTIKLLAKNKQENYKGVNVFQDPFGRKNYEWSFVDCGRQGCTTIPWPNALQITPTLESPATWQTNALPR